MNSHAHDFQPGVPPLTPAERLEQFIDAINTYEIARRAAEQFAELIGLDEKPALDPIDAVQLEAMIDTENRAQEAVVARAKTLMAGGLLDHCVDILRAETAGRP